MTALPANLHPALARALALAWASTASTPIRRVRSRLRGSGEPFVVIATPTASGKSLCFHLPVLDALLRDPDARALYFFPTKALARDQEAAAARAHGGARARGLRGRQYDGDTPGDARRAARERGGIVVTNPDMLHTGILPHHTSWARTFQNLRFIVIDELHVYRGVFGSHVANVLRRLLRVARFHGSRAPPHRRDGDDRQPARARRAPVRGLEDESSSSTRAARRGASASSSSTTRPW